MKTKIEVTEFAKIVEEIPASKFDCAIKHIYINHLTDDTVNYLYDLACRLAAEELQSCIVHCNSDTENLLGFFEVR